ncbi:MAG: DUF4254 domain-containing protein [bacterium]
MLGEAIDRLIEANLTLWHKEDERRDRSLSDSDRLRAADEITVWNRKRNQTIDEINTLLAGQLTGEKKPSDTPSGNTLLTGTIGDLIDRLAIAKIRQYYLPESRDEENERRRSKILDEIKDLRAQIDLAFAMASRLSDQDRQRLLGFGKNKSYKDEESYG